MRKLIYSIGLAVAAAAAMPVAAPKGAAEPAAKK